MKQFLLIALVAAMLLLGCTGSAPPQQNNNQPASPSANGQQTGSNQQPAAQNNNNPPAAPAQNEQQAQGGSSGGSASDDFLEMLGLRGTIQYKVAYDISSDAGVQQTSSQMTQYIKGTKKMRFDSAYAGTESRSYLLDDLFYSCSQQQGAWSCIKIALSKDDNTKAVDDIEANKDDYQITADGSMQIAGVTASCFKVSGKNIESYRACYSPEGVPLYVKMISASGGKSFTTEMKATSYSTSVSDSDFVLPAAATEIPSVPSGGAGGSGSGDLCSYCSYMTGSDKEDCLESCGGSG